MKTIKEQAQEYVHENFFQDTIWRQETQDAFIAGARAVQEWIPCSRPPKDHQVVLLKLGGEMGEEQSWGIISVTAYRESGKWYYALFGEEIDAYYELEDWRPIEYK